jgi:2-oxoisovalerate dehydrogenase E1 component
MRLRPLGVVPDLTIVCYGGMLPEVETAVERLFDEHEIVAELVCPLRLYPLAWEPLADSTRSSRRLLIVEEGLGFAAFGAEVAAQLMEKAPTAIGALARVAAPEHPIPSAGPLEKQLLPGAAQVVAAACELVKRPVTPAR